MVSDSEETGSGWNVRVVEWLVGAGRGRMAETKGRGEGEGHSRGGGRWRGDEQDKDAGRAKQVGEGGL